MRKISFELVKGIFSQRHYYTDGYEMYWYQKAWSILEHQGYTSYEREGTAAYYLVWLRAAALVRVLEDFTALKMGELNDEDYYELIESEVPPFVLGQAVKAFVRNDDEAFFDEEEDACRYLLEKLSREVFAAIGKEMTVRQVYAWMYAVGGDGLLLPEEDDMYHEEEEEDCEPRLSISCYEEYEKAVEKALLFITNPVWIDELFSAMPTLEFLDGLMQ